MNFINNYQVSKLYNKLSNNFKLQAIRKHF